MQIEQKIMTAEPVRFASLGGDRSFGRAARRFGTGAAAFALLVGCAEERAEIATAASQREANYLAMVLRNHAPEVESSVLQRQTVYRITVAPSQVSAARLELARRGLPREARDGLGAMSGSALSIPTRSEERARLTHAMTEQLRGEIERLPGVVDASIVLVLPPADSDMLSRGEKPTRLSVIVTVLDIGSEAEVTESVKRLIAPIGGGVEEESVRVLAFDIGGPPMQPPPVGGVLPDGGSGSAEGVPDKGAEAWFGGNRAVLATAVVALLALGLVGAAYLIYRAAARSKAGESG